MQPSMTTSLMRAEALECPAVARRALEIAIPMAVREGSLLLQSSVQVVEVLGRGSSSHAGTVLRYALAEYSSMAISAALPSARQEAARTAPTAQTLLVAISQSGKSPDLVAYAQRQRSNRCRVVSLVNTPQSPLGAASDSEILLQAGPEKSVAATKSTLAAAMVGLGLVAGMLQAQGDTTLMDALQALPTQLEAAVQCDWSRFGASIAAARAVYVLGRGATLGVAKEIALKITETTGVPALAFSSAEFLHGPIGAVDARTPVIGLCSATRHFASVAKALDAAGARAAPVFLATGAQDAAAPMAQVVPLPVPSFSHAFTGALLMLPAAYLAIEAAALAMQRNPDAPSGLNKVTQTL